MGKRSREEEEEQNMEERWCWLHLPELEKVLVAKDMFQGAVEAGSGPAGGGVAPSAGGGGGRDGGG